MENLIQENQVNIESMTDSLTGLYNAEYVDGKLQEYLGEKKVRKAALFIVDIDNYTVLTKAFGEEYGEDVIKSVAKNLKLIFRTDDVISRVYTDQFMIIMDDCIDEKTIKTKAEIICNYVRSLYVGEGNCLSVSVGIVLIDGHDRDPASVKSKARIALDDVKNHDKDGYKIYSEKGNRRIQDIIYTKSDVTARNISNIIDGMEADELNKRILDRLKEQVSTTDTLTGMYLYDLFLKRLKEDIDEGNKKIVIIYADIKNFRYVNDNFGYTIGDKLLKLFCDSIKTKLEGYMYASRIYSDNIAVAYQMKDTNTVEQEIEIIERAINDTSSVMQSKFLNRKVAACAGVYFVENDIKNAEIAVSNANLARKQAKHHSDNLVTVFQSYMKEDYNRKMNLASSLPSALENNEFKVYYQPKVEAGTGKVVGGEALVRWQKRDGTFIYPNEFIPFFEESGLIVDVDYYIYEEVFKDIKSRLDRGLSVVPISMNISRVHLETDNLIHYVKTLFDKYNIPSQYVEFEITESVYMQNFNKAVNLVESLKELGAKISMDDFGTGYSSLNMLNMLPIDILKIDKVFLGNDIRKLSESQKIIIKAVIEMATKLNLRTVCEGVESKEQSDFLISVGCDMIQGYYFQRPVPIEDFYIYLEENEKINCKNITFKFNGNLKSDDGRYEGYYIGDKLNFTEGPFPGTKAVHLPGGDRGYEIVSIPPSVYQSASYTLTCWARVQRINMWTALLFSEFEKGFNSIYPYGGDLRSDFRILEIENGETKYYDAGGQLSIDDKWHFYAAAFNAITGMVTFYIDDMVAGTVIKAPLLTGPKRVLLGGDIFQESVKGAMAEFSIYNGLLSKLDIMKIYKVGKEKLIENSDGFQ